MNNNKLNKSKINFLILILFVLNSCSISKFYMLKEYNCYESLKLNKDFTFYNYLFISQICNDTLYGNWSIVNDTLKLNYIKPIIINKIDNRTKIEEFVVQETDSLIFEVYLEDTIANRIASLYPYCQCEYKQVGIITDGNGKIKIPIDKKIECFTITSLVSPLIKYKIQNSKSNYFKIWLYQYPAVPNGTRYDYIDKMIIKGNKLYEIDKCTNKINRNVPLKRKYFYIKD